MYTISIHAPLAGRDLRFSGLIVFSQPFQSTRPLRGATMSADKQTATAAFQSTRPLRGATVCSIIPVLVMVFQSTRPLRGATYYFFVPNRLVWISIHAPLAGRDADIWLKESSTEHFNPRAPCGARRSPVVPLRFPKLFQSTRPLRGATKSSTTPATEFFDFNPRAPCGARR